MIKNFSYHCVWEYGPVYADAVRMIIYAVNEEQARSIFLKKLRNQGWEVKKNPMINITKIN